MTKKEVDTLERDVLRKAAEIQRDEDRVTVKRRA